MQYLIYLNSALIKLLELFLPQGVNDTVPTVVGGSTISSDPTLASNEMGNDQGLLKDTMTNITKHSSNITNITKQRVKLNIKALGVQLARTNQDVPGASSMPEKQAFRESFTAPEMSIISKLMTKVIKERYFELKL